MGMVSVRLPDDLTVKLETMATAVGRSKSFLIGQAVRDFIEREAWQIAEIGQAIQEADAGDFVSEDEINAIAGKWGRHAD